MVSDKSETSQYDKSYDKIDLMEFGLYYAGLRACTYGYARVRECTCVAYLCVRTRACTLHARCVSRP